MNYEQLKEAMVNRSVVYGIRGDDNIISGTIVSVRNYQQTSIKKLPTGNINVVESTNLYAVLEQENGITCNVKEVFLTLDDLKAHLSSKIEKEVNKLLEKSSRLKLSVNIPKLKE